MYSYRKEISGKKKCNFYLKVFSLFSFHKMSYNHFQNSQMFSRNAGIVILELPMIFHCKRQMLAKKIIQSSLLMQVQCSMSRVLLETLHKSVNNVKIENCKM